MRRREFLSAATFLKAMPGYRYQFPRDHFSHADFQTEWWYYTGNLKTAAGRAFGYELTFFRQALQPVIEGKSVWTTRDAYMAHLALTDVDGKKFFHAERLNRPGPGVAGVDASEQRIWNGNWSCVLTPTAHTLRAVDERFQFQLRLMPAKSLVVHGVDGVSAKGPKPGQASHYVSFPRLSTTGRIQIGTTSFDVSGTSWMDHEYFSSELDPGLSGWDWFSIQLENNTELMLYRLRRKDGGSDRFSAGSFVDASGKVTHLGSGDITLVPGRRWRDYPVEWQIAVPRLGVALQAIPLLDEQELMSKSKLAPTYWEGAVRIEGSHRGVGYLEMTGYRADLRLGG